MTNYFIENMALEASLTVLKKTFQGNFYYSEQLQPFAQK